MAMDRQDWSLWINNHSQVCIWHTFWKLSTQPERGTLQAWILNIMMSFLQSCALHITHCCTLGTRLPGNTEVLRKAFWAAVGEKAGKQSKAKALRLVRKMLSAVPSLEPSLQHMPRVYKLAVDPVVSNKRILVELAVPRRVLTQGGWVRDFFVDILHHPCTASWKTSQTANQTLAMVHKFLSSAGLLDMSRFATKESMFAHVTSTGTEGISEICYNFTDKLCTSEASARRYLVVFKLLFVHILQMPCAQQISRIRKRRRVYTLQEMDKISISSSSTEHSCSTTGKVRWFEDTEVHSMYNAASGSLRDSLIVHLLLTTGLRRKGLLNIKTKDIALQDQDGWLCRDRGQTTEKRQKVRIFPVWPHVKKHVESWLNVAESEGGRRSSPSPYLFPATTTDNGQMARSTLDKIFKNICHRAGLPKSRARLHSTRHTCARTLKQHGNDIIAISRFLGHSNADVTQKYYLTDSYENTINEIKTDWNEKSKKQEAASTHRDQAKKRLQSAMARAVT